MLINRNAFARTRLQQFGWYQYHRQTNVSNCFGEVSDITSERWLQRQSFEMGNSNQLQGNQLKFIQTLPDRHFGDIDIFQNDEGRFVMKTLRTHISGDRRHLQFLRIVEWVQRQSHRLVVPLMHLTTQHEKNICVQYHITSLYLEYYNYTLKDLLLSKKDLEESQLWLLLDDLLQLVSALKRNKIGINLSLDNVFLTLKGTPAVYIQHLLSFEDTICSNQHGMGQLVAKIVLQLATGQMIEQNQRIQEGKELLGPLAKMCSRFKLMGRIIRELLYRERPEHQIQEEITSLLLQGIIKKSTEVKLIKFKYLIPDKKQQNQHRSIDPKLTQHPIGFKSTAKKTDSKIQKMQMSQNNTASDALNSHSTCQNLKEKDGLEKMLADIAMKKQENIEKMQRFQQRKDELIHSSVRVREDKENTTLAKSNLRQSEKRKPVQEKEKRERRVTECTSAYNNRIR